MLLRFLRLKALPHLSLKPRPGSGRRDLRFHLLGLLPLIVVVIGIVPVRLRVKDEAVELGGQVLDRSCRLQELGWPEFQSYWFSGAGGVFIRAVEIGSSFSQCILNLILSWSTGIVAAGSLGKWC